MREPERKVAARWTGALLCALLLGSDCTKHGPPQPLPVLRAQAWAPLADTGPRSSDLRAVALDASGGVWFGTSSGVSHYDVATDRWVGFSRADGLVTSDVRAIAVDGAGGIWVAGLGGASHQDPTSHAWKSYGESDGFSSVEVQAVAVAPDGRVWFGTSNGVSRLDPQSSTFKNYTAADGLADNNVHAVAVAPDGGVWFGTSNGLSRFDPGTAKLRNYPTIVGKAAVIRALATASDGRIWLGTELGVRVLEPKSGKFTLPPAPLASAHVQAITETPSGDVWFATNVGTSRLDKSGQLETFTSPTPLVDSDVRALAAEPSGRVWFATAGGAALFEPQGRRWRSFSAEAGLADDNVTAAAIDATGNVWFGTSGGVSRFEVSTGAWRIWSHANGLADNRVRVVAPSPSGDVWVGTGRGVSIIDPAMGLVSSLPTQGKLTGREVTGIAFDATGASWLTTDGKGVTRIAPDRGAATAEGRLVGRLASDSAGKVWLGSAEELLRLDSASRVWSSFKDPNATNPWPFPLRTFAISPTGQAWFDTSDGLRSFDPTIAAWRSLGRSGGLSNVRAIAFEPAGALWLGTPGGALRFDASTNDWRTLTSADGLGSNDVTSIVIDRAGAVWFGTTGGVTRFDPKSASVRTFRRAVRDSNDVRPLLASTGSRTLVGRDGRLSFLGGSEPRALEPKPAGARAIAIAPGPTDDTFWIGTELGGLTLRGGAQDLQLVSNAGLPDMTVGSVSSLTGQARNLVWVATERGVALVERPASGLRVVRRAPGALPNRSAAAIAAVAPDRAYVAFNASALKAGTPAVSTELWYIDGQHASLVACAPDAQSDWGATQISGLSWSADSRRLWVGTHSGLFLADDHGLRRATANGVDLRLPIAAIAVQNGRSAPRNELVWLGVDAGPATAARLLRFDPMRSELSAIAGVPTGERFEALTLSPAGELTVMVDGRLARGQAAR